MFKVIYGYEDNTITLIHHSDDTMLFSNLAYFGNNIETKESLINAELYNVIEWLNMNKLSLEKTF